MTGIHYRWFIKSALVIGFSLALMAVIATLFRLVAYIFGSEEAKAKAKDALEIFAEESRELEAARMAAESALKAQAQKGQ
jgi:hypothetical protein